MIDLRTLADDEVAPPAGWAGAPAVAPGVPEPSWDQPGGLDIKEKRSWHTWHLLSTGFVAVLVGMAIGHAGSKPSTSAASKGGGLFKLPDAAGPTSTTPTSLDGETAPTTPSTNSPTATTLAAETPATGAAKVLLDKKGTGPLAATAFTIKGGTWRIGWAYDCTQSGTADGSGPFQIAVAPASGTAAIAVDEVGARSKKGVTTQTVSGPLTIEVRTACRWAVKVTGIPG